MLATLVCAMGVSLAGAEKIPVIRIQQASKYVGKTVTVVYTVRSITQDKRAIAILNSAPKATDKDNFAVVILKEDEEAFVENNFGSIETLNRTFLNKALKATGKIQAHGGKYELILKNMDSFDVPGDSQT